MSKYNVTVNITLSMEVMAHSETQAIEIAKENFDIEDHLNDLEDATKFTKAKLKDNEDEEDSDLGAPYDSDDEEDEE